MNWKIVLALALGAIGVGMVVAGGGKCTILDSQKKAERWGKKNESRTPDRFVIVGFWESSWLTVFCDGATVETVAIDFESLTGQQLKILEDQGLETTFPDENFVLAFSRTPQPRIFLVGGDGQEEALNAFINMEKFFAGEIEGQPVVLPGAGEGSADSLLTVGGLFATGVGRRA